MMRHWTSVRPFKRLSGLPIGDKSGIGTSWDKDLILIANDLQL
jgi:hypothetical protein